MKEWISRRNRKKGARVLAVLTAAAGTIISRIGKKLYIDDSPTNNLIIGITQYGKGEMSVFPSIDVYSRAVIEGRFAYENLVPGHEYTVRGILMNRKTGKPFLQDGREITAEKTFIPESPYGALEVEFTFDASELSRKGVTAFEELYLDTELVAEHRDLQDAGQTVRMEGKGRRGGAR